MTKSFQAVYQGGVLRPIESLDLQEQQVVRLTIPEGTPSEPWLDAECLAACADGADDSVTLEQVRAALAVLPSSLAEDFIAERYTL